MNIISNYIPNKLLNLTDMMIHLHDYESKLCDSSLGRVLAVIFKNRLQSGSFPNNWKKSNCKTIDQFLCCQYVKFLAIIFKPIFKILNENGLSVQMNLDFVHPTHLKTSYYQLFMISMLILINIQLLK